MALAVTMDAPDALLHIHRIPRQVEIEQNACELQIDTFAPGRCTDQHARTILQPKTPLRRCLRTVVAAAQHGNSLTGEGLFNLAGNHVHRAEIGGKDHDLLAGILPPQRINQLIDEDADKNKEAPPVNSEPITRQFLRTFGNASELKRDHGMRATLPNPRRVPCSMTMVSMRDEAAI